MASIASNPLSLRRFEAIALLAGLAAVLAQAVPRLVREWAANPNMEHVWLTLPVGGYVVLRAWRGRDRAVHAGADWRAGLPLLVAGGVCLLVDGAVGEEMLLAAGLLLGGLGAAGLLGGRAALRVLWFPALLLAFAAPLPESVARTVLHIRLQRFAAACAGGILDLAGVDALVGGTVIRIGSTRLNVVEQCSGLNSLTAMAFTALSAGWLWFQGRPGARVVLAAGGIFAALVSNVLRLVVAGAVLDATDLETALHFVHGWAVLGVYLVGLALLGAVALCLQEIRPAGAAPDAGDAAAAATASGGVLTGSDAGGTGSDGSEAGSDLGRADAGHGAGEADR